MVGWFLAVRAVNTALELPAVPYADTCHTSHTCALLRATGNDEYVPGIRLDAGTTAPIQAWFNVSIFGGGRSRVAGVELATASEPPVRNLSSRERAREFAVT